MCHRDKSVNRSEARKFFQITSKEVESGPPTTTLFRSHPFVCVCELIESAGTHASENARALVCVWCFHILPSDRSANKQTMFHIPYTIPYTTPCGKVVTFLQSTGPSFNHPISTEKQYRFLFLLY